MGAVLLSAKVAASLKAGDHGSTFGGNPVACAAGLAVLKIVSDAVFLKDLRERMAVFRQELESLVKAKAAAGVKVGPVSGRGFLIGIRWGGDLSVLQKRLRDDGVLAHRAGTDVLRLLPPLTLSYEEMRELLGALERALV